MNAVEFRGEAGPAPEDGPSPTGVRGAPGGSGGGGRGPLVVEAEEALGGVRDVVAIVGEPTSPVNPSASAASQPVVIDAMVGQVNGKPIYASRFLAPLDARLRARRVELRNNAAWQRAAAEIIARQLMDKIRDELFLAEARAELTPEQRAGLFAFLDQVRDTLASTYGGSREEAQERLLAKEGESFEGKVESEKNRALIASIVRRYIIPRVNVSWRDVTRQYERDYGVYNPQAVASIRMIAVDQKDGAGVDAMRAALSSGTAFAEAAELPANVFPRGAEGVVGVKFDGEMSGARLFESETLNAQAQRLSLGSTVGPFDHQGRVMWMHLESVTREPGLPLEEVQLKIAEALRAARFQDEADRFLKRLQERASFTSVGEMTERLLVIAVERYLIAERLRP